MSKTRALFLEAKGKREGDDLGESQCKTQQAAAALAFTKGQCSIPTLGWIIIWSLVSPWDQWFFRTCVLWPSKVPCAKLHREKQVSKFLAGDGRTRNFFPLLQTRDKRRKKKKLQSFLSAAFQLPFSCLSNLNVSLQVTPLPCAGLNEGPATNTRGPDALFFSKAAQELGKLGTFAFMFASCFCCCSPCILMLHGRRLCSNGKVDSVKAAMFQQARCVYLIYCSMMQYVDNRGVDNILLECVETVRVKLRFLKVRVETNAEKLYQVFPGHEISHLSSTCPRLYREEIQIDSGAWAK